MLPTTGDLRLGADEHQSSEMAVLKIYPKGKPRETRDKGKKHGRGVFKRLIHAQWKRPVGETREGAGRKQDIGREGGTKHRLILRPNRLERKGTLHVGGRRHLIAISGRPSGEHEQKVLGGKPLTGTGIEKPGEIRSKGLGN